MNPADNERRCDAFARLACRLPRRAFTAPVVYAPTCWNDWFRSRNSMNSTGSIQNWLNPRVGNWLLIYTSCSGFGYGSGRRITPLMTLKIAVFAPMPSASVRIAMTVKPGTRARLRMACRKSWMIWCMCSPLHMSVVTSRTVTVLPKSCCAWCSASVGDSPRATRAQTSISMCPASSASSSASRCARVLNNRPNRLMLFPAQTAARRGRSWPAPSAPSATAPPRAACVPQA